MPRDSRRPPTKTDFSGAFVCARAVCWPLQSPYTPPEDPLAAFFCRLKTRARGGGKPPPVFKQLSPTAHAALPRDNRLYGNERDFCRIDWRASIAQMECIFATKRVDHPRDFPQILVVMVNRQQQFGMVADDMVTRAPAPPFARPPSMSALISVTASQISASSVVTSTASPPLSSSALADASAVLWRRNIVPCASLTPLRRSSHALIFGKVSLQRFK